MSSDARLDPGALPHVEVWVSDLAAATESWGWLLEELGWEPFQDWPAGRSWRHGSVYIVFEQSPDLSGDVHDRLAPGLNHLAFTVADAAEVNRLTAASATHGWSLMDRHPHAGGPDTYAAYLEDRRGFEVEIVAAG